MKPKGWKLNPQWVHLDRMQRQEKEYRRRHQEMGAALCEALENAHAQIIEFEPSPNGKPTLN